MNKINTISIDLAKTVFQVAVFNRHGKLSSNNPVSKKQMLKLIAQSPKSLICMEACSSAHYWGRRFQKEGHIVRLIPAQIAKKYCSGNKNDANDAVAIYEASQRSDIHFVTVKTLEQQDLATLLQLRQSYIKQRTAVSLRARGFAAEYGLVFPQGLRKLRQELPLELEDADNGLTQTARFVLNDLLLQLQSLDEPIEIVNQQLIEFAKQIPACQLLITLRGVGWVVASALFAQLGDASSFRFGRDASASLGVVPGHRGSGGKNKLHGITKSGDRVLRALVVHGARAVVSNIKDKKDTLSCWLRQLLERKHFNNVVVALANKTIRMACAMLKSNEPYREQLIA